MFGILKFLSYKENVLLFIKVLLKLNSMNIKALDFIINR